MVRLYKSTMGIVAVVLASGVAVSMASAGDGFLKVAPVLEAHNLQMTLSPGISMAIGDLQRGDRAADLTQDPVIGIATNALEDSMKADPRFAGYSSYIMTGYVNFMETAGARVVPLINGEPKEVTLSKLSKMSGVLLPGGDGGYYDLGKLIYDTIKSYNDNGTYYPLWGTCEGQQYLSQYAGNTANEDVLGFFPLHNKSVPIKFTKDPRDTKMYGSLHNLAYNLEDHNITYNSHSNGTSPTTFLTNKGLREMYDVTAISFQEDGTPFVASMEGKKYPIFGTLFHPEKMSQAWNDLSDYNHSWLSIQLNRHFTDYFTYLARHNPINVGSYQDVSKEVVENYDVIVTTTYYGTVYVFK